MRGLFQSIVIFSLAISAIAGANPLDLALERSACQVALDKVALGKANAKLPSLIDIDNAIVPALEKIVDRPFVPSENPKRPVQQAELIRALANWRNPPEGIGSDAHKVYLKTMAGYWVGNAVKFVAENKQWNHDQKAMVLQALGYLIMYRTLSPRTREQLWQMATYRTEEGHLVLTGHIHRIVILNEPGAPMYRGSISPEEQDRVSWNPDKYYWSWKMDAEKMGLTRID